MYTARKGILVFVHEPINLYFTYVINFQLITNRAAQ